MYSMVCTNHVESSMNMSLRPKCRVFTCHILYEMLKSTHKLDMNHRNHMSTCINFLYVVKYCVCPYLNVCLNAVPVVSVL